MRLALTDWFPPPSGRSERSVEEIVAKQAAIGWSALCPITHCFGPETETKLHPEREGKRLLMEQVQRVEVLRHTHTHTMDPTSCINMNQY